MNSEMHPEVKAVRDALVVLICAAASKSLSLESAVSEIYDEASDAKHNNPEVTASVFAHLVSRISLANEDMLDAEREMAAV